MKLNLSQKKLRKRIVQVLKDQGFKINPHVRPAGDSKTTYRLIQQKSKFEQVSLHRNFLMASTKGEFSKDVRGELRTEGFPSFSRKIAKGAYYVTKIIRTTIL